MKEGVSMEYHSVPRKGKASNHVLDMINLWFGIVVVIVATLKKSVLPLCSTVLQLILGAVQQFFSIC
jgi:hypothetical protein